MTDPSKAKRSFPKEGGTVESVDPGVFATADTVDLRPGSEAQAWDDDGWTGRLDERFDVVRPLANTIGRSQGGEAFLAKDRLLDRTVVLELLHPAEWNGDPQDNDASGRSRSARALARLQHPAIGRVFDLGVFHGKPTIVRENVRGEHLESLRARLSLARIVNIGSQLAGALVYAAELGIGEGLIRGSAIRVLPGDRVKIVPRLAAIQPDSARSHEDVDLKVLAGLLMEMVDDARSNGAESHDHAAESSSVAEPSTFKVDALLQMLRRCLDAELETPTRVAVRDVLHQLSTPVAALTPSRPTGRKLTRFDDVFVGRDDELRRVAQWIATGATLVTIVGPAGVGKTRLATELGWSLAASFDNTRVCDVSEATTREALEGEIAGAIGIEGSSARSAKGIARRLEQMGTTLLVVDNVEQLALHARSVLAELRSGSPSSTFVVTSRVPLSCEGERLLRLDPLRLPKESGIRSVRTSEACRLFLERARSQNPALELDATSAPAIAELVRSLDGLPLAIELAAARVRVLAPAQMLERMRERFSLLRARRRDASERQATLSSAIEWSWDLLAPREKVALGQCAIFVGSFSLEAAEHVLSAPPQGFIVDLLEGLVDKSLVRKLDPELGSSSSERYGLLLSIRDFARMRLDDAQGQTATETGEESAGAISARARHCAYFASFGSPEALAALHSHGAAYALHARTLDLENLLAAAEFAIQHARLRELGMLARVLGELFELTGPYQTGVRVLGEALDEIADSGCRAELVWRKARLQWRTGDERAARSGLEEALRLARAKNDAGLEGRCLGMLAKLAIKDGDEGAARNLLQRAIQFAAATGDLSWEANWTGNLANLCMQAGQSEEARRWFELAISRSADAGDFREHARMLGNLAILDAAQGRNDEARIRHVEALTVARHFGDRRVEAYQLGYLGNLDLTEGRLESAYSSFRRSLEMTLELDERRVEAYWRGNIARTCVRLGRVAEARKELTRAYDIARELSDLRQQGMWLGQLAALERDAGQTDSAREMFERAERALRSVKDARMLAHLLLERAANDLLRGHRESAGSALAEAESIADALNAGNESELRDDIRRTRKRLDE